VETTFDLTEWSGQQSIQSASDLIQQFDSIDFQVLGVSHGEEGRSSYSMRVGSNWNGATETVILPADDCWAVKLTSLEAVVSPTVTVRIPPHFSVRLGSAPSGAWR
jgi:hypothetical protein